MTTKTEKASTKLKAVGYVRVSTPRQVKKKGKTGKWEEKDSLDIQKDVIKKYCKGNDLRLLEDNWYEDKGISGVKADRPGLQKLMEDSRAGKFQVVVVHSITRFGRSNVDMLNNINELKSNGVNFISVKERIDNSEDNPYREFQMYILSACAGLERRFTYERTSEGLASGVQARTIYPHQFPFGYEYDGEKRMFVEVPDEAEIYLEIVEMYLDRNMNMQEIAEALGQKGKKKPSKKDHTKLATWTSASISYILKATIYRGFHETEEGIWGVEKALISEERWNPIQSMTERKKVSTKNATPESKKGWLRNILYCGICKGRMKYMLVGKKKDGSPYGYYSCYWSRVKESICNHQGHIKCTMPRVPAEKLHKMALESFFEQLSEDPKTYLSKIMNPNKLAKDIEALEDKKASLNKYLAREQMAEERLSSTLRAEVFDPRAYNRESSKIPGQMKDLNIKINEIDQQIVKKKESQERTQKHYEALLKLKGDKEAIQQIIEKVKKLEPEKKRDLFESLVRGSMTVIPLGDAKGEYRMATRINLKGTIDLKAKKFSI